MVMGKRKALTRKAGQRSHIFQQNGAALRHYVPDCIFKTIFASWFLRPDLKVKADETSVDEKERKNLKEWSGGGMVVLCLVALGGLLC